MIDDLKVGGTESQLVALIRHLDRDRVSPSLCLLDGRGDGAGLLEPPDCPSVRLGIRSLHHPRTALGALGLARFLRRERVQILQVYFPDSTCLGVPVARLAGVPRIVRTRNNLNHWMTPGHRFLGRLYNPLLAATVVNCEACREAVLADEHPDPRSVVVLENGVDTSRFLAVPPLAATRAAATPRLIGVVANLRPVKALDIFIQGAAMVSAAHGNVGFHVAGEGELRPVLLRQAAALGLANRLTLRGREHDIPAFLSALDIAVLCSHSEGMPNAVLEYMAAGRAVVATAVGGTAGLIRDGVHGLLVPPGEPTALARAIDRLLRDPALAARLGAAARRHVAERYSRQAMVRRFEDFYCHLVGGKGSPCTGC
jgi:glycosyltransferase involved in cell wall biosynthesis